MSADAPDRDPALERAWREHSRETPPPDLDRAILAAAHRAVGSRPQPAEATRPQRWWMPLAAAAAIGVVVVGIMQTMPQDQGVLVPGEPVAPDAPASAAQKPVAPAVAEPATAMAERTAALQARRADELLAQKKKQDGPTTAPAAAPIAAPPPASVERDAASARGKLDAAHVPEPFPAAAAPRKAEAPELKRLAPGAAGGANQMAQAPRPAPSPLPAPAPSPAAAAAPAPALSGAPASASARGASVRAPAPAFAADSDARKDVAGERQQLAGALAPPPAAPAPAPPARATESVMTATPAAPAPAPAIRSREAGAARNEPQSAATGAPAPLAKTAVVTDELRAKARDPDAWIARIRKLRDDGNAAEAMRELRDFRNLVPDAERRLPVDLRDWANTVKP